MPTLTDVPELSTAADIAHVLRTSERTVQRRVAAGLYPCHRVGHLMRFTAEDVEHILGRRSPAIDSTPGPGRAVAGEPVIGFAGSDR